MIRRFRGDANYTAARKVYTQRSILWYTNIHTGDAVDGTAGPRGRTVEARSFLIIRSLLLVHTSRSQSINSCPSNTTIKWLYSSLDELIINWLNPHPPFLPLHTIPQPAAASINILERNSLCVVSISIVWVSLHSTVAHFCSTTTTSISSIE